VLAVLASDFSRVRELRRAEPDALGRSNLPTVVDGQADDPDARADDALENGDPVAAATRHETT
jgi:hypothetical protein